ncbi:DUF2905 domain-containing protein [Brachyspira pilosicoli]|uniref:DUF2905 domain-containing protein n=4 Tax=Brachyspira pilosicoli TaxID=52584 RepID=A0A3B6VNL8_BRAPL|nr:DUF2905 domain-containing protein [Brachyspira pilosicoli]AFR69885.1 hypothetical protein B2904_orf536 [Brachyspira pilosicoli B2904]AGA67350.1 hypothetical protein BPP43_10950 [Brachyspira pilosicoli P43/6/78]MBW5378456.1 DUF2905 domain-containing protein [Brachyspira pilosicoli]MBW5382315.1 DUF2905 domain-containing protein [Brachyspira pilosicoli]MBW5392319.1 DUF2905 domain-containing protein [Brachyspira pilosicoli]
MNNYFAKMLIVVGIIAIIIGILILLKIPIGKLPGDIVIKKENFTFVFPIVTSIIASIVLSFIMWIISKF